MVDQTQMRNQNKKDNHLEGRLMVKEEAVEEEAEVEVVSEAGMTVEKVVDIIMVEDIEAEMEEMRKKKTVSDLAVDLMVGLIIVKKKKKVDLVAVDSEAVKIEEADEVVLMAVVEVEKMVDLMEDIEAEMEEKRKKILMEALMVGLITEMVKIKKKTVLEVAVVVFEAEIMEMIEKKVGLILASGVVMEKREKKADLEVLETEMEIMKDLVVECSVVDGVERMVKVVRVEEVDEAVLMAVEEVVLAPVEVEEKEVKKEKGKKMVRKKENVIYQKKSLNLRILCFTQSTLELTS